LARVAVASRAAANAAGSSVTVPAAAAVKVMLAASPEDLRRQDTDEWWRERRALARKLLDLGDAATAYQVASTAAPPVNPYYRADVQFMFVGRLCVPWALQTGDGVPWMPGDRRGYLWAFPALSVVCRCAPLLQAGLRGTQGHRRRPLGAIVSTAPS
jgi:hypothetical protein